MKLITPPDTDSSILGHLYKEETYDYLKNLFEKELDEIYRIEKKHLSLIPKLMRIAGTRELVHILYQQWFKTEIQVLRMEEIIVALGFNASKCKNGLPENYVEEQSRFLFELHHTINDVDIIKSCKAILKYEKTSYQVLLAFARILGEDEIAFTIEGVIREKEKTEQRFLSITTPVIKIHTSYNGKQPFNLNKQSRSLNANY